MSSLQFFFVQSSALKRSLTTKEQTSKPVKVHCNLRLRETHNAHDSLAWELSCYGPQQWRNKYVFSRSGTRTLRGQHVEASVQNDGKCTIIQYHSYILQYSYKVYSEPHFLGRAKCPELVLVANTNPSLTDASPNVSKPISCMTTDDFPRQGDAMSISAVRSFAHVETQNVCWTDGYLNILLSDCSGPSISCIITRNIQLALSPSQLRQLRSVSVKAAVSFHRRVESFYRIQIGNWFKR